MKLYKFILLFFFFFPILLFSQVIEEAQSLYHKGEYYEAKKLLEKELEENPKDTHINYWLGVTSLKIGDLDTAERTLTFAKKKRYHNATLFLGRLYAIQYKFDAAEKEFKAYQQARRRNEEALEMLKSEREYADRLKRLVERTEDIQIIDSVVIDKENFLSAYNLSQAGGSLQWTHDFFENSHKDYNSVLFMNERKTKVYFSRSATEQGSTIYTMEEMLNNFGNEKKMPSPINTSEDQAYPFILSDGLTIYFASKGHESIGGYDLFISRYNLYSDSYLSPNQMNMPFNSPFNDYMMVIDEQKGIGWFASDRFQPQGKVCIYTFIPNQEVRLVNSEDEQYIINRAKITSIKETWRKDTDYSILLDRAKSKNSITKPQQHEFIFVINNDNTYYHYSDFKSSRAKELFEQAMNIQEEYNERLKELNLKRDQYSETSEEGKKTLKPKILLLEKTVSELFDQAKITKISARNEEIKHINVFK